jgi:DNA-binding response OmpR family regulator
MRLLIAESHDDNLASLEMLLKMAEAEFELCSCKSGHDAIHLSEKLRPEVILLEVVFPDVNGYDVARRIREIPDYTPIILSISGMRKPNHEQRAAEVGIERSFLKPYEPEELIGYLKSIFLRLKTYLF